MLINATEIKTNDRDNIDIDDNDSGNDIYADNGDGNKDDYIHDFNNDSDHHYYFHYQHYQNVNTIMNIIIANEFEKHITTIIKSA